MTMFAQAHLIVGAATLVLVLLAMLMHYEASFRLRRLLQRKRSLRRRARILILIIGLFFAHIAEIWLFGAGGWLLFTYADLGASGGVAGAAQPDLLDFSFYPLPVIRLWGLQMRSRPAPCGFYTVPRGCWASC